MALTDKSNYDEFARPELKQQLPKESFSEKLAKQFSDMPVFPIGMVGFVSMAAYGKILCVLNQYVWCNIWIFWWLGWMVG